MAFPALLLSMYMLVATSPLAVKLPAAVKVELVDIGPVTATLPATLRPVKRPKLVMLPWALLITVLATMLLASVSWAKLLSNSLSGIGPV